MELRDIAQRLADRAEDICRDLLDGGRRVGREWHAGDVQGNPGDSLKVELDGQKAGLWKDFSSDEGGDMLDLVQAHFLHANKGYSAKWARNYLGIHDDFQPNGKVFDPLKKRFKRKEEEGEGRTGTKAWAYHDVDGNITAYTVRFDSDDGKKDVLPLRKLDAESDTTSYKSWSWKGFSRGERPLYNLHKLNKRPDDPVLIVEGEKTADAAARIFPDHVCITWMGGSGQHEYADWSPIIDRRTPIIIWPDNDPPGFKCARYIKALLPDAILVRVPGDLPDGWDLADEPPEGFDPKATLHRSLISKDNPDLPPASKPARQVQPPPELSAEVEHPEIHYDSTTSSWYVRAEPHRYARLSRETLKKLLILSGKDNFKDETGTTMLDREILSLEMASQVVYAGRVAGHKAGAIESSDGLVLVTRSATILEPPSMTPDQAFNKSVRIRQYLTDLTADNDDQYWRLIYWIKLRRQSIRNSSWRQGHALILVGAANCGKSYLQSNIITPLLGGRIGKPYRYMSGETTFNGDLFNAEHLVIDDEARCRDIDSRRSMAANIKSMLFSRFQSCHPKNSTAVTLSPIWALSMSLNDEEENLQVLPPFEASILDKLICIRCERPQVELITHKNEWEELDHMVQTELSPFAAWVDSLTIPDDMTEPRCGLTAYQHPFILDAMNDASPEQQLMNLIDDIVFDKTDILPSSWKGTAVELQRKMRSTHPIETDRILKFNTACGVYLSRLQEKHPERFIKSRTKKNNTWEIKPQQL